MFRNLFNFLGAANPKPETKVATTKFGNISRNRTRRDWRGETETLEPRCLLSGATADFSANLSRARSARPVPLVAEVRAASDLDGNGMVLASRITIAGQTEPDAWVRVSRSKGGPTVRIVQADSLGRFSVPVQLGIGRSAFQIRASARNNGGPIVAASETTVRAERTDAVISWSAGALDAIRKTATAPPQASRALAMVHLAMYDAVNAIVKTGEPYHYAGKAPSGASLTAAASQAAYRVLTHLFPDQAASFELTRQESLAAVPNGRAEILGIRLGNAVADSMIALRANDGSNAAVTAEIGTGPGEWVPTPPRFLAPAAPQWPSVKPFLMTSPSQFRPSPPPALSSREYADDYREVMTLGSADSASRTADQTAIAKFWADLPGVSFTPPGHWIQIAQTASLQRKLGLIANARLFAVLSAAEADAAISCWDAKYFYDLWRPITAIRQGDQDGHPDTIADPQWSPLLATPNFSSYTSGHSTFSGAAQTVLEHFFGQSFAFSDAGDSSLKLPARRFQNFKEAADEAGRSRIYGGIHFQFDNAAGLQSGRAIGRHAVSRFF